MQGNDGSTEAEHSTTDSRDDPWSDKEGNPLVCPECGEHVSVVYRPWSEYPPRSAGFYAECACAAGPEIKGETVDYFWPPWYAARVKETESDPKNLIDDYSREGFDAGDLINKYAGGSDE